MPSESADRGGIGGGSSIAGIFLVITETCWLCCEGLLGGSAGFVDGGGAISTVATDGLDFVLCIEILLFSTSLYPGNAFDFSISEYLAFLSSVVRLGGRGGKLEGSNAGALIRPASIDEALEPFVRVVPIDRAEIEDIVEDIDSFDAFRLIWSDGLRGGSAGDGCVDCLLGGNLGGGVGFGGCLEC